MVELCILKNLIFFVFFDFNGVGGKMTSQD